MKFKQYLKEEYIQPLIEDEVMTKAQYDKFLKDCQLFLDETDKMYKPTEPLFRGVSRYTGMSKFTIKQSHLHNREPMNTDAQVHRLLNDAFDAKFGWKARNGVFVTSNDKDARRYGHLFYFIPIGRFEFIWSPKIVDLYTDLDVKYTIKNFAGAKKVADFYKNTDLEKAMQSEHEIMFKCDNYYLFDVDHTNWEDILQ